MGCNVLFSFSDDDLNMSLEPEDLEELYEFIDAEMDIINEVERNGNVNNDNIEFEFNNNELMHGEVERNGNIVNDNIEIEFELMYVNDEVEDETESNVDTNLDSSDVNEVDYDGDNESNSDFDYDNPSSPASPSLLMRTLPEQSPVLSIPSPTILHPVQPDPAQLLSWKIYNFSQQIDSYLNEFMSELEQNTPPPPSIYYYPIRFEENLETGEQILDVVSMMSSDRIVSM